jgi:hypothetical protein
MALVIDLSKELQAALEARAQARGIDPVRYAELILEQALGLDQETSGPPFQTGRGILAQYGPAPSAEEIDANRADMFHGFGRRTQ